MRRGDEDRRRAVRIRRMGRGGEDGGGALRIEGEGWGLGWEGGVKMGRGL